MSLTKSPTMTPEKLAANQANGRKSQGPATPEGRERVGDSHLRHGVYAHRPGEALRTLGEEPEEFKQLLKSLEAEWEPAGEFQSRLVRHLARVMWRLERNDRAQESMAVRRVWAAKAEADRAVSQACRPLEEALEDLEALAQAVATEDYVTSTEEIELFHAVYGEEPEGRAREILELLTRLLAPPAQVGDRDPSGENPDRPDPAGSNDDTGDSFMLPDVPAAEGDERIATSDRLQALLQEEIEDRRAAFDEEFESRMRGTVPYYRDSAIAPDSPRAAGVYRAEDSAFRQMMRLTELLMKLKGGAPEAPKKTQNEGISHDVDENKGQLSGTQDVEQNKAS